MVTITLREKIEAAKSLEEAVGTLFGIKLNGRTFVLPRESMDNGLAEDYDLLGRTYRTDTYKQIAQDFISRCYVGKPDGSTPSGTLIDIGCGSGLLTLELKKRLKYTTIVGIDLSEDMIDLAKRNQKQANFHTKPLTPHDEVFFMRGDVYDLPSYFSSSPVKPRHMVCRNALHRFKDVKKALHQMYSTLEEGGRMYLRDLRRDADWRTIVSRIGEHRWKSDRLVLDYIGAMAQMLTTEELGVTLMGIGIDNFKFCHGEYLGSQESFEHGKAVEYVCIVTKS